jgi:hypothetical protein
MSKLLRDNRPGLARMVPVNEGMLPKRKMRSSGDRLAGAEDLA